MKDKVYSEIYTTTNYNQFKFLEWNRVIDTIHVERLISSFSENLIHGNSKNKMFSIPILVNKDLYVLDGQHRLLACKKLEIPILYTIEKNNVCNNQVILSVNTKTKIWTLWDYVTAYAKDNNPNYLEIIKFKDNYPEFRHTRMIMNLLSLKMFFSYDKLKQGLFKITDIKQSNILADRIIALKDLHAFTIKKIEICKSKFAFDGIMSIVSKSDYDEERMIEKINKYPSIIYPCVSIETYREMFLNAYNYKSRNKMIHI